MEVIKNIIVFLRKPLSQWPSECWIMWLRWRWFRLAWPSRSDPIWRNITWRRMSSSPNMSRFSLFLHLVHDHAVFFIACLIVKFLKSFLVWSCILTYHFIIDIDIQKPLSFHLGLAREKYGIDLFLWWSSMGSQSDSSHWVYQRSQGKMSLQG